MGRASKPRPPRAETILTTTFVRQAGRTATQWGLTYGPPCAKIGANATGWGSVAQVRKGTARGCVLLETETKAKGSGKSEIEVSIYTPDFPAVLAAMCKANRRAAMVAMASEMLVQMRPRRRSPARSG